MSLLFEPDLFQEAEAAQAPDNTPTFVSYERPLKFANEPEEITLRLVGKSPLWGHLLWNAGRVSADYIERNRSIFQDKTVLELGAAAALPALLASLVARNVVATDFPDPDLIDNIQENINWLQQQCERDLPISTQGFTWGADVEPLLNAPGQNGEKFDFIILSDLIFNHSEHRKLLKSCKDTLAPNGTILVVFTPHRPWLYEQDLAFFTLAEEEYSYNCEKIITHKMQPMFKDDPGAAELRETVFGYILTDKPAEEVGAEA